MCSSCGSFCSLLALFLIKYLGFAIAFDIRDSLSRKVLSTFISFKRFDNLAFALITLSSFCLLIVNSFLVLFSLISISFSLLLKSLSLLSLSSPLLKYLLFDRI